MIKVSVLVRLKHGVLDVQGKAIESGLKGIGVEGVSNIRVGRLIELDVNAPDFLKAKNIVTKLCEDLLANTVIESYEIKEQ